MDAQQHFTVEPLGQMDDRKLGEILKDEGLVNEKQLQAAYSCQSVGDSYLPIGQILVKQKIITIKQLNYLLDRHWKRPQLGDILIRSGAITKELLDTALANQKKTGLRLGEQLVKQNFLSEKKMREVLCTQLNIPFINLENINIDRSLVKLINRNFALKNNIVPIARIGDTLTLAMDDPTTIWLVDELESMTGMTINVVTSTHTAIKDAFARLYEDQKLMPEGFGLEMVEEDAQLAKESGPSIETQEFKRADTIVSKLITLGLSYGASDIHLESLDRQMITRFRIDGVLKEPYIGNLQEELNRNQLEIISRIKIIGKLDITERRRPQDGSFRARIQKDGGTIKVDFRISIVPGYYGENIVIRILDARNAPKSFQQLGFSKIITNKFNQLLLRNEGLLLITGPTGSGKSTTLYGALMTLFRPGIKVLTAENPIEYVYENITQCEVNEKIGNTFANYIRAFLRQDPEVIMVGEIRDPETAQMALKAAQTGHMVLSTLHTNDTLSSIMRLFGLGVDPSLIAACLIGVLSQRLVRQICPKCKQEYMPPDELIREFFPNSLPPIKWFTGQKCSFCNNTGYKGRIAVSQLWIPSDNDIILINKGIINEELRISSDQSTNFMVEDALRLLQEGRTNLEELIRTLPYSCTYQFRNLTESFFRKDR
ncbi:MAG: Flp pilus assembly complex ATPase component TadA [Anaerolineales bacterium]|nr:Flp pilus assembly complex ATPase component TadA [Anaerolineales bacterium]